MRSKFNIYPVMSKGVQLVIVLFVIISSKNGETSSIGNEESSNTVQGLYDSNDKLVVLSKANFNSKLYNKSHAWLIEFYNSWCGFCRRFAPTWKAFAANVADWKNVVTIGAIDCANDENNDICRNFEILSYPTLKYFHQNYIEGPDKLGETIDKGNTELEIEETLIHILQKEQTIGKGINWPNLSSYNYSNTKEVWEESQPKTVYIYLLFDNINSTVSTQVILDLNSVTEISVRKVRNTSQLAKSLQLAKFPSLVLVEKNLKTTILPLADSTKVSIRNAIIMHLLSKPGEVSIPEQFNSQLDSSITTSKKSFFDNKIIETGDIVYQADLETGLRFVLNKEISRSKHITGDALEALKNLLNMYIKYFPFTANGKEFMIQLRRRILHKKELTGQEFAEYVQQLEDTHAPVYSTLPEWYGCKGSAPQYRGFTCSLWTTFHVLTVSAAAQKTTDASEVLRAMHGYVKYFFGCTDCSEHFQAMAKKNNLFSVAENDGAIIWLWVAHNEVNHRLAGDITEDPDHPKRQFPVIERCPKCWRDMGAWNLTEVLNYLKHVYGINQINLIGVVPHSSSSPFSKFDITIFILLHIYFAVMLLLVLRMILIKKIYRRKSYKSDVQRSV